MSVNPMRILILNWRDIKNPKAGGAELLTHEMSRRWVEHGHAVTLLCERFEGSASEEVIDGVRLVRLGRWWSVHLLAVIYYFFRFRTITDVIVDEVHWFPFFSILYAPKKTVLLVCEVANQLFFRLFPYPLAILGRYLEKIYVFLYRSVPVIAISRSTIDALVREGFPSKNITLIPMGLTRPRSIKHYDKASRLTLIVIGRLHVLKGTKDAIEAFVHIRRQIPSARLWIVGSDGQGYQAELEERVHRFNIDRSVLFFGHVSQEKKFKLLSQAHILLMPSVQEGWGLVVTEAASQGTPAVGYRTAGLQDVIRNNKTGILVPPNRFDLLATEALKLWMDKPKYRRYQIAAKKHAASMNWDDTARVGLNVLQRRYEKK